MIMTQKSQEPEDNTEMLVGKTVKREKLKPTVAILFADGGVFGDTVARGHLCPLLLRPGSRPHLHRQNKVLSQPEKTDSKLPGTPGIIGLRVQIWFTIRIIHSSWLLL